MGQNNPRPWFSGWFGGNRQQDDAKQVALLQAIQLTQAAQGVLLNRIERSLTQLAGAVNQGNITLQQVQDLITQVGTDLQQDTLAIISAEQANNANNPQVQNVLQTVYAAVQNLDVQVKAQPGAIQAALASGGQGTGGAGGGNTGGSTSGGNTGGQSSGSGSSSTTPGG